MNLEEKKNLIREAFNNRCIDQSWLYWNTIFLSVHGSTSYALDTPESDGDMVGICIPTKNYYYGFLNHLDQFHFNKPDGQIYSIHKFFKLAVDNNPNVMELLWIDKKYWIQEHISYIWKELINNRDKFLSRKVRYTYSGYALSQLHRIKNHRRWIMNPMFKPTREQFGLPINRLISRDQQGALDQLLKEKSIILDDNFMQHFQQENAYNRAKQEYEQYENWLKTRNHIRATLETKFGFDTKYAAQVFRLIKQCEEILLTGTLNLEPKEEDKKEILAVKNGGWTYKQVVAYAEAHTNDTYLNDLESKSLLPKNPDRDFLDKLLVNITNEWLNPTI